MVTYLKIEKKWIFLLTLERSKIKWFAFVMNKIIDMNLKRKSWRKEKILVIILISGKLISNSLHIFFSVSL